jgi:hypothetical protein
MQGGKLFARASRAPRRVFTLAFVNPGQGSQPQPLYAVGQTGRQIVAQRTNEDARQSPGRRDHEYHQMRAFVMLRPVAESSAHRVIVEKQ